MDKEANEVEEVIKDKEIDEKADMGAKIEPQQFTTAAKLICHTASRPRLYVLFNEKKSSLRTINPVELTCLREI